MRTTATLACALATMLLAACGDDGSGPPPPPTLSAITIAPDAPVLADGRTLQLDVAFRDNAGSPMTLPAGATLAWSSSAEAVASVGSSGLITANAPGNAEITAAVGTVTDRVTVTVTPVPTVLVAVSGDAQEGSAGAVLTEPIIAVVHDRHGSPVAGVTVSFSADGTGTVDPAAAVSNDEGRVSVAWTLADEPGGQMLTATVADPALELAFTAVAMPPGAPPVAVPDSAVTAQGQAVTIPVLANDHDPDGDDITTVSVTQPGNGTAHVNEDGSITYTPSGAFAGSDEFTYSISDDAGNVAAAAVHVRVTVDLSAGLATDDATVVLYKFDEAAPGTSSDAAGNGHDGIDYGTTVVDGPWGRAREFDGVGDRIDMDAVRTALQGAGAFTIEALMRSADGTTAPGLINHSCANGWYLQVTHTNLHTNLKTTTSGGGLCPWSGGFASEPMSATDRNWHHYALVWDGAEMRSYRDGLLLGTRPVTGTFTGAKGLDGAWIGWNPFADTFAGGMIDEVRVSSTARDAAEVADTWLGLTWNWPRPAGAQLSLAGDSVNVWGWNLADVSTVRIGGIEAPIDSKANDAIAFLVPNGLGAGTHDVQVETNDGRFGLLTGAITIE